MKKPNQQLVSVKQAATDKGCSVQGIYQAIDRGALTEMRLGSTRLVLRDAKYQSYKAKRTGGRAHKSYLQLGDS